MYTPLIKGVDLPVCRVRLLQYGSSFDWTSILTPSMTHTSDNGSQIHAALCVSSTVSKKKVIKIISTKLDSTHVKQNYRNTNLFIKIICNIFTSDIFNGIIIFDFSLNNNHARQYQCHFPPDVWQDPLPEFLGRCLLSRLEKLHMKCLHVDLPTAIQASNS